MVVTINLVIQVYKKDEAVKVGFERGVSYQKIFIIQVSKHLTSMLIELLGKDELR